LPFEKMCPRRAKPEPFLAQANEKKQKVAHMYILRVD